MIHRFKKRSLDSIEKMAVQATRFVGSTESLLVHTALFIVSFLLYFWGVPFDTILLVVTTIVSLEAIYLSIFIQMSVNRQARKLHAVALDVEDIQEDVDEIQKDVDEIQKDVDEIQEDVEDIQEDVEDIQEEDEIEEKIEKEEDQRIEKIENMLGKLIEEILDLKKQQQKIKEVKKRKVKSDN